MPAEPCLLIPTGSREAAEHAARAGGFEPVAVATKDDCADRLGEVRGWASSVRTLVIHSPDWRRQPLAQFYELAAARLALPATVVVDDEGRAQLRAGPTGMRARAAAIPLDVAGGLALAAAEAANLRRRNRADPRDVRRTRVRDGDAVLAIWLGASPGASVGGAVTHVSGVLGGLRRSGLRVVLLTLAPPPAQIEAAVDDAVIVPPLPRRARATVEISAVAANRAARREAARLVGELRPAFVYQRYDAFTTCGVEVARDAAIPVVLEWNNSEVWTRQHWHQPRRFKRLFFPLLQLGEDYVASRADVVASVSEAAGQMAVEAGASSDRVLVVPNAVDLEAVDAARANTAPGQDGERRVGWVGSFGTWHGAEVLVQALPLLPANVRAVMIGDGVSRGACEELARKLGVWERVDWTGSVPHSEAVRRLAACDLLASPHVPLPDRPFFGSPTKLFEYMGIGRPIVASRLEQLGEVLEDGRTARLVAPGDVGELAAGISELLADPARAEELGVAARQEAETRHTWDERARTILDRLAGGERAPAEPSVVP